MNTISAIKIQIFLYNKDNGFLIKYHRGDGIDTSLLNHFYEILEILKEDWQSKKDVPKDVLYYLISIVPALYRDLEMYTNDEQRYYAYIESIYELDTAISMCLNPDSQDIHFNTPLNRSLS